MFYFEANGYIGLTFLRRKETGPLGIFLCLFYGTGSVEEITLIYTMIVLGVNSPHNTKLIETLVM